MTFALAYTALQFLLMWWLSAFNMDGALVTSTAIPAVGVAVETAAEVTTTVIASAPAVADDAATVA